MGTRIWAHRGASAYAPENTAEAFLLAVKQQADGVELDVQLTRDGQLAVIHDETIDRVCNGSGYVKDMTLSELRQFDFNKTCPQYRGAKIPILEEVLDLLRKTELTVNIELKNSVVHYPGLEEKARKAVLDAGMQDRVIYSSFNHSSLILLKKMDRTVKTGMLYSDGLVHAAAYAENTVMADALHPADYLLQDPDLVKEAGKAGLKIHVWTVNQEKDIRRFLKMGVDALITNCPDVCRSLIPLHREK